MASLLETFVDNYNEFSYKDPEVDGWFLMSGPMPVLSIVLLYLYFVLKLGPQMMQNRPAFELKRILIVYNLYQILFSVSLGSRAFIYKDIMQYIIATSCADSDTNRHVRRVVTDSAWYYFFSKVVDLLDTVFFVLRKKQRQVTFLHVYHHSSVVVFSWCYLKFLPGEQGVLIGLLNSLVHAVMYTYYLIAAFGPKYQKYLWWKKYMTWLQLAQFCLMLAYLVMLIIMDCKLAKALTFFIFGNVVIFLYLFSDFYQHSYLKPKHFKVPCMSNQLGDENKIYSKD